jgi:hypothetical protein
MKTPLMGAIINTTDAILKNIEVSPIKGTPINAKFNNGSLQDPQL